MGSLLFSARLWDALWVSNQAMVVGFLLAATLGIAVGVMMGRWRAADAQLDPYLTILLVTPMSAIAPILIMATGLGMVTRILVVFSFSVVAIAVNTRAGMRTLDPDWVEMARAFGASEWQLWRTVLLPGALASILAGLRLGLAQAITGMVFVELFLLALGLGRLLLDFQGTFESAHLYATVLVIVVEAVLLTRLCTWLAHRAAPWDQAAAE